MTLKYLATDPAHCKHTELAVSRTSGAVRGVFLLSDEALRGSAVRSLGPGRVGEGMRGEIQMTLLLWEHDPNVAPRPAERGSPLAQLTANSAETSLRLGNLAELKCFLAALPVLLRVRVCTIRDFEFYLKDLFLAEGLPPHADADAMRVAMLDIRRFSGGPITVYEFLFSFFLLQAIPAVLAESYAVLSAIFQIGKAGSSHVPALFAKLKRLMRAVVGAGQAGGGGGGLDDE